MSKLYKGGKARSSSLGRFLLDVIKPAPTLSSLGKRSRDETTHNPEPDKATVRLDHRPPPAREPRLTLEARPASVALQHEDTSEDAIVITALDIAPFCCHADLLMMSRAQLLAVASSMNAKLPRALQIDTSARTAAAIRHSIELLVGIRTEAAPEPKRPEPTAAAQVQSAVRPRSSSHLNPHSLLGAGTPPRTPLRARGSAAPISPLASRTRPRASLGTPALAILREDPEELEGRPAKRRRQDLADLARGPISRAHARRVTPFLAHAQAQAESTPSRDVHARSQSRRGVYGANLNVSPSKSKSKIPRAQARSKSSKSYSRGDGPMTSTPNRKRLRAAVNSPGGATVEQRFRPFLADVGNGMTSTPNRKRTHAAVNSPGGATVGQRFRPLLAEVGNLNANANTGMAARAPSTWRDCQYDINDMTFGLEGLTMPMVDLREQMARMA